VTPTRSVSAATVAAAEPVELGAIVIFQVVDGLIAERWAGWMPGRSPQTHPALAAPVGARG
jgi:hypothetical protein